MNKGILQAFGQDLWCVEGDRVRMYSIPFETRMTVVRLRDGGLWLHSPVAMSPERLQAVESLGEVKHLVAPNKFHHLFLADWAKAFPRAKKWCAPGLAPRVPKLAFDEELKECAPPDWAAELDQMIFRGSFILPEVFFFHRASKSLLITDYLQNHRPESDGLFWRTIKRWNGILAPKGGVPRDLRLSIRDRSAAKACRDRVLAWDFDQIILSHGLCIQQQGRNFFQKAFAWLD